MKTFGETFRSEPLFSSSRVRGVDADGWLRENNKYYILKRENLFLTLNVLMYARSRISHETRKNKKNSKSLIVKYEKCNLPEDYKRNLWFPQYHSVCCVIWLADTQSPPIQILKFGLIWYHFYHLQLYLLSAHPCHCPSACCSDCGKIIVFDSMWGSFNLPETIVELLEAWVYYNDVYYKNAH